MRLPFLAIFLLASPLHAADPVDLQHRIQTIVIPSLEFKKASLDEVLDTLKRKSIALDSDLDPEDRGVWFIVIPDVSATGESGANTPGTSIDYTGTNVKLTTVLREIGLASKHDIYVTSAGIVVCPAGQPPFPNPKATHGEILEKLT